MSGGETLATSHHGKALEEIDGPGLTEFARTTRTQPKARGKPTRLSFLASDHELLGKFSSPRRQGTAFMAQSAQ